MRIQKSKFLRGIMNGTTNFNAPITFGGAPHNFNYNQQSPAPMAGGAPVPPANPSKVIPGANASTAPEPNTPNQGNPAPAPSPLAKYADFFQTTPNPNEPPKAPTPQPAPTILDAGSQHYLKAAEKMDFTSSITPEQRTAMAQGGEAGVQAMMDVINNVGRQVYAHAGATSSTVAKKSSEMTRAEFETTTNKALTLAQSTSSIASTNAVLQDPVYAPMVKAVQTHFLSIKPTLTPTELAELTVGYFDNMSSAKQAQAQQQNQEPQDPFGLENFFSNLG